jgi:hypothetical protein
MTDIRARIEAIRDQMLTDLPPVTARQLLVELTALYYGAQQALILADHAYARELTRCFELESAASRARIRAETSVQFLDKRNAAATVKFCEEAIRSLKALMRSTEEEIRMSR